MTDNLRILIIGGYGVFGGRTVELLEDEPSLTLIVGGRSVPKAEAFVRSRTKTRAQIIPAAFDRDGDVDAQMRAARPHIVIDASGPFQAYGDHRYRVVEACIAQRVHYLDLADGSDFVAGIRAFEMRARTAGIYVLSGASSFPVLNAAVVRSLALDMSRVDTIFSGIAPSPYAGVGTNVIRAIAGYSGQKVFLRRGGADGLGYPLTESMRFTVAPPGRNPLTNVLFSLVDVPDLRALAELWPNAKTIWVGAGPSPEILHRALIACAWLVRFKLLPSLSPLAPLMHFVTNHFVWGEPRGGMFVVVEGIGRSGAALKRSWHMLAEGDDGPLIPSMAVASIVRKTLIGDAPAPGARAASKDLELRDYEKLFAGRAIYFGTRTVGGGDGPIYAKLLDTVWNDLPAEIRAMHDVTTEAVAEGRASVERGRSPLARIVAAVVGFPQAVADTEVRVRFGVKDRVETWTRTFGNESFFSRQFLGRGRSEALLCEQFGPLTFAMALVLSEGRLSLVLRRWAIFGLPLPMWMCPRSNSYESAEDGRFRFHVEISHPLTGLIVRYQGWLLPVQKSA